VYRIAYLAEHHNVVSEQVLALMFNRLAGEQFRARLEERGLGQFSSRVFTFHSFAYRVIQDAQRLQLIPPQDIWSGCKEEWALVRLHIIIRQLESQGYLSPDEISVSTVQEAITLWKASLIAPDDAGHAICPAIAKAYKVYETWREEANVLLFEDFLPLAVTLLEKHPELLHPWLSVKHLFVDEFQDVNWAQLRLVKLLAANSQPAVMGVGDDDQTIYSWRGARPEYLIGNFGELFNGKPIKTYPLTRSFRFGPSIACAAQRVIQHNQERVPKTVEAHFQNKQAKVIVVPGIDSSATLAETIVRLLDQEIPPRDIQVLGRLYAQLTDLQIECLTRKVPFYVLGQQSFFERQEVQDLLNYCRVSWVLDQPCTQNTPHLVLSILNTPTRYLSRKPVEQALKAGQGNLTLRDVFSLLTDPMTSPFGYQQRKNIDDLVRVLDQILLKLNNSEMLAGQVLAWLVDEIGYLDHFGAYYGGGENANEHRQAVIGFLAFARLMSRPSLEFLKWLKTLDTRQGKPNDQCVSMTSVHKAKGLEWPYVFIPTCQTGFMPCQYDNPPMVFDRSGKIPAPRLFPQLEAERRLMYVALTRASKAVYIGSAAKSPFVEEIEAANLLATT
jgi:DNA helicase-2/ATP-dependent DNA helicase PcrA